jgi:hypothetical protein
MHTGIFISHLWTAQIVSQGVIYSSCSRCWAALFNENLDLGELLSGLLARALAKGFVATSLPR